MFSSLLWKLSYFSCHGDSELLSKIIWVCFSSCSCNFAILLPILQSNGSQTFPPCSILEYAPCPLLQFKNCICCSSQTGSVFCVRGEEAEKGCEWGRDAAQRRWLDRDGVGRGRSAHPEPPLLCSLSTPSEPQSLLKNLSPSSCSPGAIPGPACPVHCTSPSLKDNGHGSKFGNHWCNIYDIYACSICRNHIQTSKSLSSKWLETGRILWKSYMLALFLYSFLGSSLLTTVRKKDAGLDELMVWLSTAFYAKPTS